jgi:hypothetical protein
MPRTFALPAAAMRKVIAVSRLVFKIATDAMIAAGINAVVLPAVALRAQNQRS